MIDAIPAYARLKLENVMKAANLYIRVSTDEQAEKGYSQRHQDELLHKYCEINAINVHSVIYEDYSAKTFNRPAWSTQLTELKKQRGRVNLILFTKWDRFSRNAGDAYQMISLLRKLGVEPQAIEQPLDLSIPENKMMLAFYLAAPEVENDRRALNVITGMRRAKKEGRWMGAAPIGYQNKTGEDGRKFITRKEPEASIMRWAFEEMGKANLAADQIRKKANKMGLKCGRSNFWYIVRNPVYCGKIFIPMYKDEESRIVNGLHEPIISESLFNDVQDILDGNKRKKQHLTKTSSLDNLPLRGYLICPLCGKMLTGSASKGRTQRYYYYHCQPPCGCRLKADHVNDEFEYLLETFNVCCAVLLLYETVITIVYKQTKKDTASGTNNLSAELQLQKSKLAKARDLILSDAIDLADYNTMKTNCEEMIAKLESKLAETNSKALSKSRLSELSFNSLSRIGKLYKELGVNQKREIIILLFSGKICFDGRQYKDLQMTTAAQLVFQVVL